MMNIEVISEELIKPSHPTPSHLRYLKASLFDQVNIPILMPLIFFFSNKQTPTPSSILTRLKNSLCATLSIFYPLAGRVQDSTHITCNDEGVPYLQAHLPYTSLSQVVHKADVSLLDKLLPSSDNTQGYTRLVLVIQVNTFACGGIAVGIKINHIVSDGFSLAMFVKTWAEIANGGAEPYLRPCFEIWREFPPHGPIVSEEPDPGLIGSKPVTKWFMFSKPMCDALKARLCLDNDGKNQPSVTMVISAFIYSRIKLLRTSAVNNIPDEAYHAVNIRPKVITPPGYDYYFGNMVVNAIVNSSDNHLEATRESIKEIIKTRLIDNMRSGKEDLTFMMDHFERESRGEITSLGFSSLRGLPVYEADFGWGKPVWVTSATLVFRDLMLIIAGDPSRQDTYVYVNLSPDEMSRLEADHHFNSFVSKSATFVNTSKL